MASVLVPPTLLPLDQRREIFALPNEDAGMYVASSSPVAVWWRTEPRLDLWVSAGALAFAVGAVVLVLV